MAAAVAALPLGGRAARAHGDLAPALEEVGGPRRERPFQPWQLAVGGRAALFRSAGYDAFSTNDAFAQTSALASWALRTSPVLATAVGASLDVGSASAQARGSDASLSLTRVALVLEERYAPRRWGYAFVRVSPGWLRGSVSLADPAAPAPLEATFSTFGVDGSLGVGVRLTPARSRVSLWGVGDGGYGWAPAQRLALAPALPAADRDKAGTTTLTDLAPRGAFGRVAVALTF